MRNVILWSFFGAMLLSCEKKVTELNIVREEKVEKLPEESVVLTADEKWEKLPNGLYRAEFEVPPYLTATKSARDILEGAGITFGKGSSATYDPFGSVLVVEQAADQMELIDLFLNSSFVCAEKGAYVRFEIYELPSAQALQLMESAQNENEHSPERNAALSAVRKGKGKLVQI